MNDSERTIMDYVNRAQLAINDWQCSNETYYLGQAQANLGSALELERAARVAALTAEKEKAYSVDSDDIMYALHEEALEEARSDLTAGEIATVIQLRKSSWRPEIDVDALLEWFEEDACEDGGDASEYWSERIESKRMAAARAELEQRLNAVLQDWVDEHELDADWYEPTGVELSYKFDGEDFKRI